MWNNTKLTKLLNIKYPIIQGPFGGNFSSVKLASTVSNLGGMGSYGLNSFSPKEIININHEISQQTNQAYALNLWVPLKNDPIEQYSSQKFEKLKHAFKPYFEEMNVEIKELENVQQFNFEEKMEAILAAKPPVASFIFGIPSKEIIKEVKNRNITSICTATSVEEAVLIQESGIDAVIASGSEAGGHRSSFLQSAEKSLLSTRLLVPQIAKHTHLPIIAAGGISTGKDIIEMLDLGADAAQLGTAFLATEESNASQLHKEKLLAPQLIDTELTKVYTGRLARTLKNNWKVSISDDIIAPYPLQSRFLSPLRKAYLENEKTDFVAFWAGQASAPLQHTNTTDLFHSLVKDISTYYSQKSL